MSIFTNLNISSFSRIFKCNLMCLFLGLGVPYNLLVVAITCLSGNFCGNSLFPYLFLGFALLVIISTIITYIVFLIVGDPISIERCNCSCLPEHR